MQKATVRWIVHARFTRGYNEQHVDMGKPDPSGQELFINELKLPVHKLPIVELRDYHLKKYLPSTTALVGVAY